MGKYKKFLGSFFLIAILIAALAQSSAFADDGYFMINGTKSVSYTHLDVYKRQIQVCVETSQSRFTDIVMYTTDDGTTKIEATFDKDTVWPVSYTHLLSGKKDDLWQRTKKWFDDHYDHLKDHLHDDKEKIEAHIHRHKEEKK